MKELSILMLLVAFQAAQGMNLVAFKSPKEFNSLDAGFQETEPDRKTIIAGKLQKHSLKNNLLILDESKNLNPDFTSLRPLDLFDYSPEDVKIIGEVCKKLQEGNGVARVDKETYKKIQGLDESIKNRFVGEVGIERDLKEKLTRAALRTTSTAIIGAITGLTVTQTANNVIELVQEPAISNVVEIVTSQVIPSPKHKDPFNEGVKGASDYRIRNHHGNRALFNTLSLVSGAYNYFKTSREQSRAAIGNTTVTQTIHLTEGRQTAPSDHNLSTTNGAIFGAVTGGAMGAIYSIFNFNEPKNPTDINKM